MRCDQTGPKLDQIIQIRMTNVEGMWRECVALADLPCPRFAVVQKADLFTLFHAYLEETKTIAISVLPRCLRHGEQFQISEESAKGISGRKCIR